MRGRAAVSRPASGAIAVTAAFIAITCWWLIVDRSVPYGDSAQNLVVVLQFRDHLERWAIGDLINQPNYYPPGVFLLGTFATFLAGESVAAPVLAQNLLFVPLLAAACFQVGRMVAGPLAGLLAVVFALGTPLMIEQFHVFMLDAPQATLVAVTVWCVLASERFTRLGWCVLGGIALGAGVEAKELAPLYLVGLVACVLARGGGWRNWRGWLTFGCTAFLVGAPWYLQRHEKLGALLRAAGRGEFVPVAASPPAISLDNGLWYFWATLDGLLFAPLFAIAAVGVVLALVRVVKARPADDLTLELLVGLVGSWAVLTFVMAHHDMRYTMGLIVFIAVLGTAWIARLGPRARTGAIGLLTAAVVAAHLGATFGVGGESERRLPGNRQAQYGEGVPPRDRVIVYANHNFAVSKPHGEGDVLTLFRALRDAGARGVYWSDGVDESSPVFERIGLLAFAMIAGLESDYTATDFSGLGADDAILIRELEYGGAPACIRLSDGTGVWVRLGDPAAPDAPDGCPWKPSG